MVTIDQIIAEKLENWYVGEWPIGNLVLCTIALLLSILLCGAVGFERERRGRTAGLRTHLLVGVGSCMIMIISIYGFPQVFADRDVARLAAQVIAGVGFLGAGAIIHRNSGTKGLTTAATIWIVMAIGLACGSMNFILAIGGTFLILLVLVLFRKLEVKVNKKNPMIILHASKNTPIVTELMAICEKFECTIGELQTEKTGEDEIEIIFLAFAKSSDLNLEEFLAAIEKLDGVHDVSLLTKSKA